jgi:predicted ABC-type ATPase
MKKLTIIAGCNGAGKTTASYAVLPKILDCDEFVNADEIARGLSPFNTEKVSFQAGRLMLSRINELLDKGEDFAFETTLSTKSYKNLILEAKEKNYQVTLLFFWLNTQDLAVERVKTRVREGGHHIPENIIRRRYEKGLNNFFAIFKDIVDEWIFLNNSKKDAKVIARNFNNKEVVYDSKTWKTLNENFNE